MKFRTQLFLICLTSLPLFFASCNNSPESLPEFSIANTGPYILNISHLEAAKSNLDDPFLQQEYNILISGAGQILQRDDYEYVTDKPNSNLPPSGDKNDYMSIARYWWPDSTGAYTIQSDGRTNPAYFDYDRPKLADIQASVYTLSLAYFFSDDERFAQKAAELIRKWFIDDATRMNPNMNHAQVRIGVNTGDAQGIIDANDFIWIIESISLIYDSPNWTHAMHLNMKEWFYRFSRWYVNDYNADALCDENWCNNVSTWMDVQRASFFLFSEQDDLLNSASHILPIESKINKQFNSAGIQEFEFRRRNSQHYVYFNLRGFINIATLRKNRSGHDRDWNLLNTQNYGGLKPALDIIADYLNGADVSGYFDVDSNFNDCRYLEIFKPAAIVFESQEYEEVSGKLIQSGCSDPDINLAFPSLQMIHQSSDL